MLGTALALLTREGMLALIVPEDERDLVRRGWVAEEWILGFAPATRNHLGDSDTAARLPLEAVAGRMGLVDILREDMVCNLEPAIYLTDFGGLRHCDMVAVLDGGSRLLSPFHSSLAELLITG